LDYVRLTYVRNTICWGATDGKHPPRGRGPSGAVREAEEAQAGGEADPRDGRRRLKRDGIHGPGIAALMAEAGLARRHRTAGRAAVRET